MPIPALAPGARILEDLRGIDVSIDLGGGLVDVPPGLRVDDGAFQLGPSIPAEGGRGCLGDEEPLVLPGGDRQEVELGSPVEDGTHQIVSGQFDACFFEDLTHGCGARIFALFDPATDREPPESLRLIFVVALGQEDPSSVIKEEDAGGLPVGIAVRVHRPVECAHASRVARWRRKPHTRRATLTTRTGISITP